MDLVVQLMRQLGLPSMLPASHLIEVDCCAGPADEALKRILEFDERRSLKVVALFVSCVPA
jgi:hypothetical protein